MTIIIAGGGIGGLCAAIALAHQGMDSHIIEQADEFSEVGAGIQVGPNGMRILQTLGVAELLEGKGAAPEAVHIYDALKGVQLNEAPLGAYAAERYGAPYKVFHRAELQMALLEKARSIPQITIQTGFRLKEFFESAGRVTVHSISGEKLAGSILIGADGMWSRTRRQLFPDITPTFYGKSAWRTIVDIEDAPAPFNEMAIGLWMSPSAHLVHYPVRGGKAVNLVAVITEKFDKVGWSTPGQSKELMQHYKAWDKKALDFLESVTGWQKWALFSLQKLPRWSRGHVVLLGDAAHPPLPFLAQGGVMAIEDAFVLAKELKNADGNYKRAFKKYEEQRRERVYHITDMANKMCNIYHMKGFMRQIRNMVLQRKKPEKLLADYDWLYGLTPGDDADAKS